jgi:uncharacterized protein (DUF1684 family)
MSEAFEEQEPYHGRLIHYSTFLLTKKYSALVFFLCVFQCSFAQSDSALLTQIKQFQNDLNNEYINPATSPLQKKERENFKGILFFPINPQYIIKAKFIRTPDEKIFAMPTSGNITKKYVKFGEARFTLTGKPYKLSVYRSIDLAAQRKYRNYLFIPFRDITSGKETYGGGRYIDLTIPQTDTITINFNLAYQPYCAYTEGYNCPIPPRENYLPVKVEAGVRF